jgi:hypothetical protein
MVDTLALGASAFGCEGSSPSLGTNFTDMIPIQEQGQEQKQSDLTLETTLPASTKNSVEYIDLGNFWPVQKTPNPLIQFRYKITLIEEEE